MNELVAYTRLYTQLYETDNSKVFCTLTVFQRVGQERNIIIHTPDLSISPSLYNLDSLSTGYMIQICNIRNGTYVDYVNSVALCMLKHELKGDIVVAAKIKNDMLVYSPLNDTIRMFIVGEKFTKDKFDVLKEQCLKTYEILMNKTEL